MKFTLFVSLVVLSSCAQKNNSPVKQEAPKPPEMKPEIIKEIKIY